MVLLIYFIKSFADVWKFIIFLSGITEMCALVFYGHWLELPWIWYAVQASLVYMLVRAPILGLMFGMQLRRIVHSDEIWTTRFIVRLPHGSKQYSLEEFFREVQACSMSLSIVMLVHVITSSGLYSHQWAIKAGQDAAANNLTLFEAVRQASASDETMSGLVYPFLMS